MNRPARLSLAALVTVVVLSGCANHPELRPYSAEETRQLQLEALQRQGFPQEAYEQRKLSILRSGSPTAITDSLQNFPATRG
ncbi:hypothetical protein P0Y43_18880 [Pseudomonas entomophila]|uniref:hypothetical protein n=1 Tax=Pseudomonas entomophila TaxID=312306 RepID=UPI0023D8A609|nr:hypothetical protein [Pseudomonas entomophila]MDF0732756.1 hypothetical protein [Pseudomonas entomophila]